MRVFATAAAVAFAAMMAWSSSAGAVDVEIHGYPFGCKTPDGETRKPKFGDVGGMYFAGLPQGRKACLETIDRMIYSCGANTTFISHDLNNQYADCLPIFEQQAEWCARHFELQRSKCDAGGTSAPAESSEAAAEPAVELADRTMWVLKRSNIRLGPGTDHAKVGLLEVGDAVQVTGEIGAWLRIAAPGGGEAFVYAPLLTEEAPAKVAAQAPAAEAADTAAFLEPKCSLELPEGLGCWQELTTRPGCHIWIPYLAHSLVYTTWSGECAGGTADGEGRLGRSMGGTFHTERPATFAAGKVTEMSAEYVVVDGPPDQEHQSSEQVEATQDEFATTTTTADSRQTGPLHGSITFSQEADGGYAWGIAWSFDSRAGALAEATDQCREYGGTGCEEAGWFENACGALAIGDGNGYGTGGGATTAEAERDALRECRAANADCRVEVARCSQSEEAGGRVRTQGKVVSIDGFNLSCPEFPLIGPGMKVGDTIFNKEDWWTFEIPQEKHACGNILHSAIASCLELYCNYEPLPGRENQQCANHFVDQGVNKCGLMAEELGGYY